VLLVIRINLREMGMQHLELATSWLEISMPLKETSIVSSKITILS